MYMIVYGNMYMIHLHINYVLLYAIIYAYFSLD